MVLKNKKLEELKMRLNDNFSGSLKKIKQVDSDKIECYKNREEFPKDIKKNKIYVDSRNNAVLLPISGVMVPFHINIIKNVAKHEEGKFAALRFNFHTPLGGLLNNINLPTLNESTIFVKELTYRSENLKSIGEVFKSVKDLQRKLKNQAD
jgi:nucleosome binding factor SPN SPT16 subunit